MDYKYFKIPEKLCVKEEYPDGANWPTIIEEHKCFCKKGIIRYCYVPGFNDDWFEIKCPKCDEKYNYIERIGNEWKAYLAKTEE